MAGKKNNVVVSVISGLTETQAANINRDIMRSKQKNAPHSRGTSGIGVLEEVATLLSNGFKQIGGE